MVCTWFHIPDSTDNTHVTGESGSDWRFIRKHSPTDWVTERLRDRQTGERNMCEFFMTSSRYLWSYVWQSVSHVPCLKHKANLFHSVSFVWRRPKRWLGQRVQVSTLMVSWRCSSKYVRYLQRYCKLYLFLVLLLIQQVPIMERFWSCQEQTGSQKAIPVH